MLLHEEKLHFRSKRELTITFFQILFVASFVITELLTIRLSLLRLNPPRLMITQILRYFGMSLAGLSLRFFHRLRGRQSHREHDRLPATAAATLTLIDIAVDAAMKIAFMLAPEHSVEAIFGLLSLLQALISFVAFGQPVSPGSLAGAVMQTYGYFLIAGSCAGEELSVRRGLHPFFGAMPEFAGVFFAVVALVLQVISLTMVEALSGNVKLTVGELCRGNGFMGFAITAAYHGFVLGTKTERYVVLVPPTDATWLAVSFVVAAAVQQYAQSWLVLRTRAVEYARTAMFASLVLFAIRHSVYREDGAAYGFYQIPPFGGMLTLAGFVLISLEASGGGTKRVDPSLQVPEA